MANQAQGKQINTQRKSPRWIGYVMTVLIQAVVTATLVALRPVFPLAHYPFLYIFAILIVGYLYGEGPAVLAFLLGLVAFTYPVHFRWPPAATPDDWARIVAFLVGTVMVGLVAVVVRRARDRIERLAQELDRQRALMDTLMQNVPVGLGFHDRATRHVLANRALAEMNLMPLEELLGKTVWEILPPDFASQVAETIERVFATGEPSAWRDRVVDMGGMRHFNIQHLPVRTLEGETIGVGVVVVDITDQVKARQEIERLYEREHHIAETLQTSLLTAVPEKVECFRFETLYRAALEEARVGGDFYDVFRITGDKIGVVIGDVSGKGLSAAVQVAMAKYSLRGPAYQYEQPSVVMDRVNKTMVRSTDLDGFVTMFFGVLDCTARTLTYTNGGHAPALFWKASEERASMLEPTGPLVGTIETAAYREQMIVLGRGDELLLGTDGLFEIRCGDGFLGLEGLLDLYTELKKSGAASAEELVRRVLERCTSDLRDDVAILRVSTSD